MNTNGQLVSELVMGHQMTRRSGREGLGEAWLYYIIQCGSVWMTVMIHDMDTIDTK